MTMISELQETKLLPFAQFSEPLQETLVACICHLWHLERQKLQTAMVGRDRREEKPKCIMSGQWVTCLSQMT